ncbi:hypothetical protein DSAG12_03703 [Promethearchaeum syntrophicum]|uniref:Uncharacterized protein n=1 Tax=Promethearchaeum syntrophicum TaxID=2594042 RepID=A0A5B9DFN9_9ARCH|nr:hypothetical protein [Candidatus Prometheoarchaeum syntrophicum]QEE17865.1 hypothetical protein DSAG12_03703 [Candidatus Prometheoarchaeum syntrophicum]
MTIFRKNAKPKWSTYNKSFCIGCGETFCENERILSGLYCSKCGPKKEKEMQIDVKLVYWYKFKSICVKCAKIFSEGEQILFGLYCSKCGKKWIKERDLRRARLKKARRL